MCKANKSAAIATKNKLEVEQIQDIKKVCCSKYGDQIVSSFHR